MKSFPIIHGITDLRLRHHDYSSHQEEEETKLSALVDAFENMPFEELARFSKSMDGDPPDLCNQYLRNKLAQEVLSEAGWLDREYGLELMDTGWPCPEKPALELGCGWGGTMLQLTRHYERVIGVDINICELIMCKKLLHERGRQDILLVCAGAEALPFQENSFGFVNANDVIEHVRDPEKVIEEAARVLCKEGALYFNSPNRYALLRKETHVQIYGVGFIPRRYQKAYVSLVKGCDYKSTCLRSHREISRIMGRVFPGRWNQFGTVIHRDHKARSWKGRAVRALPRWATRMLTHNRLSATFGAVQKYIAVKG